MGILVTLGWIALILGIVLIAVGYTIAVRALRPGWAAIILGVVLLLIGYLLPELTTHPTDNDTYDTPATTQHL